MSRNAVQRHPMVVLGVLVLGLFMTILDLTIVNIAIPSLLTGIQASLDQVLWVLNGYSLVYAVLLITSSRLGDYFGPRQMFLLGIGVFTVGSGLSGLAQTPLELILTRGCQGLGAAMLAPQTLPLMLQLFPVQKRAGVFAIYGIVAGVAVLAGPTLGGALVTSFGWRSIFLVNIPIGALTLGAGLLIIPDLRAGVRHRLDVLGVLLASGALLLLIFGLIEGQRYAWGKVWEVITIPELLAAGGLLLGAFLIYEARRQTSEPLLPFDIFRDRNFSLMAFVLAAMGFAILGAYLPLTVYPQSVLGLSAVAAGLTIAPQPIAMMISSGIASGLSQKVNGKYILIPGLLLFAIGLGSIAISIGPDASRWSILPGLLASGFGLGFVWTPLFSIATRDLTPRQGGVASGVINTVQELGTVLASAVIGAFLQNRLATSLATEAAARAHNLPSGARPGFVAGFKQAASGGLQLGTGQTGAALHLPPGLPAPLIDQIRSVAEQVFVHGFVDAMKPTLVLPIVVLVVAAAAVVFVLPPRPSGGDLPGEHAEYDLGEESRAARYEVRPTDPVPGI
ncbi:MAG: MFS transporter [Candidatus Dormibacteraceae bacterium]